MSKYILQEKNAGRLYTDYMEGYSAAYLGVLASAACCDAAYYKPDNHGIDVHLQRDPVRTPVRFQLKSTTDWILEENHIVYDIKVKSYNKLTGYSKAVPAFLALLTLPPFGEDWHLYSENAQLSIRQSLYWHFLGEEPEVPDSDSTKRIRLSRHHLVTSDWLVALFKALQAGQGIDSVLT